MLPTSQEKEARARSALLKKCRLVQSMDVHVERVEGGIFREEMPHQLLAVCKQHAYKSLLPVFRACEQKADIKSTFERCMETIREQWAESDFDSEALELSKMPRAEEALRESFVSYVRLTYSDVTQQENVRVRVTVPSMAAFYRTYLKELTMQPYFSSGEFFKLTADVNQQDSVCKQCIRGAFATNVRDFVIVEDFATDDVGNETPSAQADTPHQEVLPDDSASNVESSPSCAHEETSSRISKIQAKSAITSFKLEPEKNESDVSRRSRGRKREGDSREGSPERREERRDERCDERCDERREERHRHKAAREGRHERHSGEERSRHEDRGRAASVEGSDASRSSMSVRSEAFNKTHGL